MNNFDASGLPAVVSAALRALRDFAERAGRRDAEDPLMTAREWRELGAESRDLGLEQDPFGDADQRAARRAAMGAWVPPAFEPGSARRRAA